MDVDRVEANFNYYMETIRHTVYIAHKICIAVSPILNLKFYKEID